MQDRVPLYPGRVTLTPVEGQANTYDMVREDQPTQAGTPLSKANLLKDATAAQFGLGVEAVPDDVLSWVGKYNEYWWSLLHGQAYSYTEYVEKKQDIASRVWLRYAYTDQTIQYSKEITIDQSTGAVSLKNPSSYTIDGASKWSNAKTILDTLISFAPCYMTNLYDNPTYIYYLPEGATYNSGWNQAPETILYDDDEDYGYNYYFNHLDTANPKAKVVSSEAHTITVPAGETTYEHSVNRNAYPDSGTVDGITYTFLGKPFEKFPTMPQIEIGNYTGIGQSGQSYQCAITCNFVPKIILIYPTVSSVNGNTTYTGVLLPQDGVWTSWYNSYPIMSYTTISISGTTVSWYSDSNAKQMNSICKFYYIALG